MQAPTDNKQANTTLLANADIVAAALAIAPQHGKIVSLLLINPVVSNQMIADLGINSFPTVVIRRLRIRLAKHGIGIRSQYSIGYSLSPEDRWKLLATITKFMQPVASSAAPAANHAA
jgi:hypothetical protein